MCEIILKAKALSYCLLSLQLEKLLFLFKEFKQKYSIYNYKSVQNNIHIILTFRFEFVCLFCHI